MKNFSKIKTALAVLLLAILSCSQNPVSAFQAKSYGEVTPSQRTMPSCISLSPGDVSLTMAPLPEEMTNGETLTLAVTIHYTGEPTICHAVFSVDGTPLDSDKGFFLYPGRTVTHSHVISPAQAEKGGITISFQLYSSDTPVANVSQSISLTRVPTPEEIKAEEDAKRARDKEYILTKVKPVCVEATVRRESDLYSDVMLKKRIGSVKAGTSCQVIASKTDFSNQIRLPDGRVGWVSLHNLNISTKNYTKSDDLTNAEKDMFVRCMEYTSKTDYLIWVNLERQTVNLFQKKNGTWCIERVYPCASGMNQTPTINGVFSYYAYENSWKYDDYYVGPVMVFSGNYALHSILMRYDGRVYDGTIGRPASHGCVRMKQEDVRWLADNIPFGTTVVVY